MEGNLILNEQAVHYRAAGDSPASSDSKKTLILLHGWGQSGQTFAPLIASLLGTDLEIIAPDMPGFGQSQLPAQPFSVSDYAEIIVALIEKMKLKTPLLVAGHSFGGRVAIKLAAEHPELVEKLILIDAAGVADRGTPHVSAVRTLAKIGTVFFSLPGLRRVRSAAQKKFHEAVGASDYANAGALKETFVKVIEEDLSIFLPKIKCKTFLIWGEEDTETPLSEAEKMHRLISDSELTVLKNAGHFSYLDAPQEFLTALTHAIT